MSRTVNTMYAYPLAMSAQDNDRIIAETMLQNAKEFGGVKVGLLPVSLLFVDHTYQRPAQSKVKKIAQQWDDNKAGFLLVSYRETDARFAIIDGGNRFEAAKLIGKTNLACQILTGISIEQEALVFAAQNENRSTMRQRDMLKALVCAKDAEAIAFQNLVEEFGLKTYNGEHGDAGYIGGILKARNIYHVGGDVALRWIFDIINKANWYSIAKAYSASMLNVLWTIYQNHETDRTETARKLVSFLTPVTPSMLTSKAMSIFIGHGQTAAVTAFLECYLDGKLPHQLDTAG